MLADSAQTLLHRFHDAARLRRLRNDGIAFDPAFWATAAEAGWLGLRLSDPLGGLDLDADAAAAVAEALGRNAVTDPFAGAAFFPAVVLSGLSDPARAADLPGALMAGQAGVAVIDTDVPVGPGLHPTLAAPGTGPVMAYLRAPDGGESIALIHKPVEPVARRDGSFGGRVGLAEADLAAAATLATGAEAARLWRQARHETTLITCAALNGVAARALDLSLAHVQQREQFGRKLADFQVLQHMLVELRCQLRLSEAAVNAALRQAESWQTAPARLAMHAAKARASDCGMAMAAGAIQLHGALGFTDEADISLYAKIAMHLAQTFGTAASHRDAYLQLSRESGHVA